MDSASGSREAGNDRNRHRPARGRCGERQGQDGYFVLRGAFKLWRERRLTGFPAGDGRPRGGVTRGERWALAGRVGKVRSWERVGGSSPTYPSILVQEQQWIWLKLGI